MRAGLRKGLYEAHLEQRSHAESGSGVLTVAEEDAEQAPAGN